MSFTVSTPAASRALLSTSEIAAALPGSDATRAGTIALAVSDLVARLCRVPSDGVRIPTLLSEGITQTERLGGAVSRIYLARRNVTAVASVTADGVTLSGYDYVVEPSTGTLTRLEADEPVAWDAAKVVIVYTAGFATIPPDLKIAAETILREQWSATLRDPLLRSESVDGVGSLSYWVNGAGTGKAGAVSDMALGMLAPYRYYPL